jgi:propanol-preferring alcohol dehydrogenase
MKAMVLEAGGEPFVLKDLPDPVAGPGEAVARVLACGAGLTIHHVRAGRVSADFPRIIGHEITAEIVETGAGVSGLAVDDPVTAHFYLTCGHCKWCRINRETLCENSLGNVGREVDGGYAEYIKLPARNFIRLPEALDHGAHPAEIGVICDAIATPFKVLRHARVRPGERVAVFGAGGGVGLHMVMMAAWAHTRVIAVDIAADKLAACRRAGAGEAVDASRDDPAEALAELTGGRGVDVAIDFVSSAQTLEAATAALGRGGRLVTLGGSGEVFRAPAMEMLRKELELIGSRYATRQEIIESLELVARGEVWPIITEIRPLVEAEAVHELLETGSVTGRAALIVS